MMNAAASDGIAFASEDLGLAPLVDSDDEGGNFDAFNEDTFGAEDVWHEDDHEEVRVVDNFFFFGINFWTASLSSFKP